MRRIPLPFGGDSWAQPNAQAPIPASVQRLRCTGGPIRWRVIGYDGVGPNASPVDGDASTYDITIVKILTDKYGNTTLSRTVSTVESEGTPGIVGQDQTEVDVSQGDRIAIGVRAAAQDTADALWIFVDTGAFP